MPDTGGCGNRRPDQRRPPSIPSRPIASAGRDETGPARSRGDRRRARGDPSELVRAPALQGLIGTLAGPRDPGTSFVSFTMTSARPRGCPAPGATRGGMGAVTGSLRAAAENAGVIARLGTAVERVLVEDEVAIGLVPAGGDEIRACARVSNAIRFGRRRWPASSRPPAAAIRSGGQGDGAARRVLTSLAWPGPTPGAAPSTSVIRSTSWSRPPGMQPPAVRLPRPGSRRRQTVDPTLTGDGRHVVSMFCQCFPAEADDAAADAAIARFALARPTSSSASSIARRSARGSSRRGRDHRRTHLPRRDAARPAIRAADRPASLRRRRAPLPGRLGAIRVARSPARRDTSPPGR